SAYTISGCGTKPMWISALPGVWTNHASGGRVSTPAACKSAYTISGFGTRPMWKSALPGVWMDHASGARVAGGRVRPPRHVQIRIHDFGLWNEADVDIGPPRCVDESCLGRAGFHT